MKDRPIGVEASCEAFLEELERLPLERPEPETAGSWRELLPQEARVHAMSCSTCEAALEDFAESRQAWGTLAESAVEPSPWFMQRVMAQIRAQEEEQTNGVWVSVRRIAPRLAAFAAVLLVLGGTWVMELRRVAETRQQQMHAAEGLFEGGPNTPPNDDIVVSASEEPQP
jgi:hypothetical protein